MTLKTWHKITTIILIIIGTGSLIYYFNLSNRHKAIVKTQLLHFFRIVDPNWQKDVASNQLTFESPSFLIDNIYKSMEGPLATHNFYLDTSKNELLWMTGFKVQAKFSKNNAVASNDFICHSNIDYIEQEHHGRWNLLNRMYQQHPRLISLSHGIETVNFPKGYGYPFFSDETFFMSTQTLNHNITDSIFQIKHTISINYSNHKNIKPLFPKTLFMMLPFDLTKMDDKYVSILDNNSCVPIETKNHTYYDDNGQIVSGHWKIKKGKQVFRCNVTKQLAIQDTLRLHQITPHLHPFAEQFILKDVTTNEILYNCIVKNHKNRIGLNSTPAFSSIKGVLMFPDHDYELILSTNNTSDELQDMMASMFLFFYDKEMAIKTKNYFNAN
ncbi:hypothetical protein [Snuella sedimenti]|uniref:Uncharacterized protein n=1 Tax=Snuella sedimenti TaxID=2798802 RepID=A0A8J7LYG6_9FLAO|nr:hypothetical protein [Snuella sedimenti]MBJ6368336.1 hypothetical protein [Snuella sedimenti]